MTIANVINTDRPDSFSYIGELLWVLVCMVLVIGLIFLFVRFLSQRSRGYGANRSLRTLGGLMLGQHKSMQVVELGGKIYVVGVGDEITLLDKLVGEEAEALLAAMEQTEPPAFSLVSWLQGRRADRQENVEADWRQQSQLSQQSPLSQPDSFQSVLNRKLEEQAQRKARMQAALKEGKLSDRLMDE